MGWSTQEIADLAGTTLRTVRHYHEIGLLPEPPRGTNGYKSYGVSHLTQLLHIRRLVEFGAPLSEIRTMDLSVDSGSASAGYLTTLRRLDDEAQRAILRFQAIRAGIRQELKAHEDGPEGEGDGQELSPADEDFMKVLSRVLRADALESWNALHDSAPRDAALVAFADIDDAASPERRAEVATELVDVIRRIYSDHPELVAPALASGRQRPIAREAIGVALKELYRPAQLDVLARVNTLLSDEVS
ncbi:MerR family transcriptional regulator [Brachybacterium subflavum]|uniref:MerR family transcriptional regulator n=1 Tax=Brachybacterium subflavum TaxID=2585206 RepID=UPI00187AFCE4|nr:MerR family transcriptional regulator [Brachybacterium subflavum]